MPTPRSSAKHVEHPKAHAQLGVGLQPGQEPAMVAARHAATDEVPAAAARIGPHFAHIEARKREERKWASVDCC
jgi:hypothetical protein